MRNRVISVLSLCFGCLLFLGEAKTDHAVSDLLSSETLQGLKFRNLNPTIASGRISDLAVNPNDHREYYVGTAGGDSGRRSMRVKHIFRSLTITGPVL